jgi:mono/diheme cytochrome c family protein
MRLKLIGVIITVLLAAATMAYWFADVAIRESLAARHEEELAHYGEVIFSDDETEPAAAGCARCHGDDGMGGEIPNDPEGRTAPSLHTASLAEKLRINPEYVRLVVSFGGVVVSGNVNSPMPAWSAEVGGPLNEQQIEAVVGLVEGWAVEAGEQAPEEVENTVEAGEQVFNSEGCAGCHGPDLMGSGTSGPNISTIGSNVITDFGGDFITPSGTDQMIADYEADPRAFLETWIRDSSSYNGGEPTGMPPHNEEQINESQMQALITFLLAQTGE